MQLVYSCGMCGNAVRATVDETTATAVCRHCGDSRKIRTGSIADGVPTECVVCGCRDLWRQKDFPPQLGLTIVGIGTVASTIAWAYYWPMAALAILMGFALLDLLLYAVMKDVLVCYRCAVRHRNVTPPADHARFDLEVAERYRQEQLRLKEAQRQTPSTR